jgi:[ribosomal protein S5]-alanine N-acetyltransferase
MHAIPLLKPGTWMQVAIADPQADVLLGDAGLFVAADQSHAEIGFTLARAAQGAGLATAAVRSAMDLVFAHTPVARIVGITDLRNTASIRLLERVGMRPVDSHEAVFKGEPCVELVFAKAR